jgi:hypothetical protein
MRVARVVFSIFFGFVLTISLAAQQATTSNPQAVSLLQRSLDALSGGHSLTDVTLSGTARRIAGSDDDTGTAVFKGLASGAGRTDLSLSSGQRSEVANLTAATPTGAWSGPDRISHAIANHNLLAEPVWFFPAFAIARRLSSTGYVGTYVGHETHNGQAIDHISVSQTASPQIPSGVLLFQHLTQVEFFLDSTSFLPSTIAFTIHPDKNALLDIPVEVRFSDYRPVSGAQVPFHVQKYLNNSLILDFQATSVTFNSGLTAVSFSL